MIGTLYIVINDDDMNEIRTKREEIYDFKCNLKEILFYICCEWHTKRTFWCYYYISYDIPKGILIHVIVFITFILNSIYYEKQHIPLKILKKVVCCLFDSTRK